MSQRTDKTPWTPGPWTAYKFSADWHVAFESDDSGPALTVRSWWDDREANARLIAAAPEMAEAHDENARILGYLVNELQGLIPAGKLAALDGCLERSQRMSAKARGEK